MANEVQDRIKQLRIDRNWTQQELADAVGVSRQSINSIERNRYVPSLLLALMFSKIFGCGTDEIFTKIDKYRRTGWRRVGGRALRVSLRYDHVWSWDLLAVGVTIAAVKMAVMAWSLLFK
jgi:putative transcriptional regulator